MRKMIDPDQALELVLGATAAPPPERAQRLDAPFRAIRPLFDLTPAANPGRASTGGPHGLQSRPDRGR